MSDHDRYVTGNYGTEHPDNAPTSPDDNCARCVTSHDGYCEELGEWLCVECLILAYSSSIKAKIGKHIDDACSIDEAFDGATARTSIRSENYVSIDLDIPEGEVIILQINELTPNT